MQRKTLFFFSFSLATLFLTVYLSQFSLALYIFLLSFAWSHSRNYSRLHQSSLHSFLLFFFPPTPNARRVRLVSSEFFHWTRWILDTCPNLAVSNEKIYWTEALPMAEWTYFSFPSFLSSTCLTSLTSHLHSRGLTFVHSYIEKRITSILLFGKLLQAQSTLLTSWQFFQQAHLMS